MLPLCCSCNPLIYEAAYTEEENAGHADRQSELGVAVASEGRQRIVGADNVHRLDNLQIVVE